MIYYSSKSTMNELKQEIAKLRAELKEMKENPEIWVPIKDNWAYFISNRARVKTYDDFYPKVSLHKYTGYYNVKLNGRPHYLHRLLAQAFIPNPERKPQVDHIDGNRQNNCLSNLRWATCSENSRNRKKRKDNSSEYTGVSFDKTTGKWRARIYVNGKEKHLGLFHTKEEASAVYEEAARKEFGEFFCET